MTSKKYVKINDFYCRNTENGKHYSFSEVVQILNKLDAKKNKEITE